MIEALQTIAAQTNTSAGAIGAICAVAVACLAFWLAAVAIASRNTSGRRREPQGISKPVVGGAHLAEGGRSVAPNRYRPAVPAQRSGDADQPARAAAASDGR